MSQVLGQHVSPNTSKTFWELGGTSLMAMALDGALQAADGRRGADRHCQDDAGRLGGWHGQADRRDAGQDGYE
jgi:hypothetical protein